MTSKKVKKMPAVTTFIAYVGADEVLVTTPDLEAKMLRRWFKAAIRSKIEYDRKEFTDWAVCVHSSLRWVD